MAIDTMEFANRVGNEMLRILSARSQEELARESNHARMAAALGAALLPVSECLRVSILAAANQESMRQQMVGVTLRMLQQLLDDVLSAPGKG